MKKMKKGLAFLLSAVMLLGNILPSEAAENTKVTITAETSTSTPKVGDAFTVAVKLTENTGFNANDFHLQYDEEVVKFLGFETTYDEDENMDVLSSDFALGSMMAYNNQKAIVTMARERNTTKTGTLFTAKFQALKAGDAKIGPKTEKFNMTRDNGDPVDVTWNFSAAENLVVSEAAAENGYTVSLTPNTQAKLSGETAQVKINVTSGDKTDFHALYAKLTYDPTYLTLTTASSGDYTISDKNGTVEIVGYGEAKTLGDAVTLEFTVDKKPENGTLISLSKAAVDEKENAAVADAPEASYGNQTATITVAGLNVTIPEDDFNGSNTVTSGQDYTFTAKNPNYDYTFAATMGGADVKVKDNGDGTYTVENVTGDLVISIASKKAKSFTVTVTGAQKDQVTYAAKAVYGTDYSFIVKTMNGYTTNVIVTISGKLYTGYQVENDTYKIPGADLTGNVQITIENKAADYKAEFNGTGAGLVSSDEVTEQGKNYTFKVAKRQGYSYQVSATMGGVFVEVKGNGDGTYTIENVTGDLVITVAETVQSGDLTVEVSKYVKLNGKNVYLVAASKENLTEGAVLAYDSNVMYWSESYQAYVYLIISERELTTQAAAEKVSELTAVNAGNVVYTGDVNGTTVIDVNDAQLVYNIYNAEYESFEALSMLKFLNADINGDKEVDATDAAAIVNKLMGN